MSNLVIHKWVHIYTEFSNFPLCFLMHIRVAEMFPGTPDLCPVDHSQRGEATEVETWVEGKPAILCLSELRNPKGHVGKEVRDRSLGLCLELGFKPGHSASFPTRLLSRISASVF